MASDPDRRQRIQQFLDALYQKMREYGVVTTVCYEAPIRAMVDALLDAERAAAVSEP